ncbi:MAG: hypothetical protein ABIJ18_04350 [archaeon]
MSIDEFVLQASYTLRIWIPKDPELRAKVENGQLITCPYTTRGLSTKALTLKRNEVEQCVRYHHPEIKEVYCWERCDLDCPAKEE